MASSTASSSPGACGRDSIVIVVKGIHHVAVAVDDLEAQMTRLNAAGVELIDHEPRRGLYGMQVAFVHPSSVDGVLSELVSHGR